MPGLPYNLEIVKRVKHGDKLRYIVQQSKPQRGERRYAVTDEVGQPFSDLGFFLKYELKLSPQAAPELFIQREKNSPMKKVTD